MPKYFYILFVLIFTISCTEIENKEEKGEPTRYQEKYRPQYHFTPPSGWMNDPNGMVYYAGEYHLFYQHNPDSTVWGPMHWGHAVSEDLVNWEHLPIAIYPDSLGTIFSGSAVLDQKNTSGLGTENNPPLVAIYTYHNAEMEKAGSDKFQTQGIAYSIDSGRNWQKYEGNPVLKNPGIKDFRDPKVSWHSESQKWIMSLAVKDKISFYSSPDLLNWTFESDFGQALGAHGGVWECPDLFPLDFAGEEKWILLVSINPGGPNGGSATQYFIGDFDGKEFTTEQEETLWVDYGTDNYAGVTWSNVNDKQLFLGWMSNWQYANIVPTDNWRSAMTIARELSLSEIDGKLRLLNSPVENYKNLLQKKSHNWELIGQDSFLLQQASEWTEFSFKNNRSDNQLIRFDFFNDEGEELLFNLDFAENIVSIDRSLIDNHSFSEKFKSVQKAPMNVSSDKLKIEIYKDASSVEIFINEGELVMSALYFSEKDLNRIRVTSNHSMTADIQAADFHSIW
ncbi:fructan beta-fructosidase [Marivirga sericea]|uniref:Fructan beta-fructosidase n=1 Tax=Marivirga sericea TaxID=1028 RepID=A0A1X7KNW3_9BACT|nr:glycoside hydrolase family 32 protein [Marivirga sericea]SMG42782.1 fructan beta-fructosidase [Marivirga sericea]